MTVSTRNRKKQAAEAERVGELDRVLPDRTGWRCRNTLFMTAYARDRSSLGYGLRKRDRHTGLRRMDWSTRSRKLTTLLLPRRPSRQAAHHGRTPCRSRPSLEISLELEPLHGDGVEGAPLDAQRTADAPLLVEDHGRACDQP